MQVPPSNAMFVALSSAVQTPAARVGGPDPVARSERPSAAATGTAVEAAGRFGSAREATDPSAATRLPRGSLINLTA